MPSIATLVPLTAAHAAPIQRLVSSDREILAQTRLPDPYPADGAARWIEHAIPRHRAGEEYSFAIENARGDVVGACGMRVSPEGNACELGYWIGRPYRNRGYATAAVNAAVVFVEDETDLELIFALPLLSNVASCRVLEKAGFTFVRSQPAEEKWAGERQAVYELRCGADRWGSA